MVKKKLNSYKGRLNPQQIADGMNVASRNARRLIQDAEVLFENGCFATAMSLAILSIEESGKLSVLRSLALAANDTEIKEAWKDYRSHTKKNVLWLLPQLVVQGKRTLEEFRLLVDESSDHPYLLDQLKQVGFYTDCLGDDPHWSEPSVIEEAISKSIIEVANMLAKNREITVLEIELWIKHLQPVWKRELSWMKKALHNWHEEMKMNNLVDSDDDMAEFVR